MKESDGLREPDNVRLGLRVIDGLIVKEFETVCVLVLHWLTDCDIDGLIVTE